MTYHGYGLWLPEQPITTEEMTEAIMSSVQGMYEIVGKYIMPILAFSALCTLFLTVPSCFWKTGRRNEYFINSQWKFRESRSIWLFSDWEVHFCIGLNCLMMLSALALSSLAYSGCGYADECGRAVDLYDHRCCGRAMFRFVLKIREKSTFFSAALLSSWFSDWWTGICCKSVGAMGMVLAYSYEICGTIKVPILLHITVNVMGILLTDSALGAWDPRWYHASWRKGSQRLCRFFNGACFWGGWRSRKYRLLNKAF